MAPCLLPPGSYSKLSLGSSLCVSHTVTTYALVLIRGDGGTWAGAGTWAWLQVARPLTLSQPLCCFHPYFDSSSQWQAPDFQPLVLGTEGALPRPPSDREWRFVLRPPRATPSLLISGE